MLDLNRGCAVVLRGITHVQPVGDAMKKYRKPLRLAALSIAIGMCFASAAHGQSNITGTIYGTVPADANSTVVVQNMDTGQTLWLVPFLRTT